MTTLSYSEIIELLEKIEKLEHSVKKQNFRLYLLEKGEKYNKKAKEYNESKMKETQLSLFH